VIYYVFLRGQRVPEWIERVEPAGFFDVHWTDDAEVFRYADRVEVHPMFPRTAESPPLIWFERNPSVPDGPVRITGAPTMWNWASRHFPSAPLMFDFDLPDEGEEWKA
jgi:hypothetical protein